MHAVRGHDALEKLLRKLEPARPSEEAARRHLLPEQVAEVAWDRPCAACGTFAEGPINTPDGIVLAFRCPRQQCQPNASRGRVLLLDEKTRQLADQLLVAGGGDLSELVCRAVQHSPSSTDPLEGATGRATVRLTLTLDYIYRAYDERRFSSIVKAALKRCAGATHAGDQRRQARV